MCLTISYGLYSGKYYYIPIYEERLYSVSPNETEAGHAKSHIYSMMWPGLWKSSESNDRLLISETSLKLTLNSQVNFVYNYIQTFSDQ